MTRSPLFPRATIMHHPNLSTLLKGWVPTPPAECFSHPCRQVALQWKGGKQRGFHNELCSVKQVGNLQPTLFKKTESAAATDLPSLLSLPSFHPCLVQVTSMRGHRQWVLTSAGGWHLQTLLLSPRFPVFSLLQLGQSSFRIKLCTGSSSVLSPRCWSGPCDAVTAAILAHENGFLANN